MWKKEIEAMMKKNSGGKRFVYKAQKRINNRSQQVVHLNKRKVK